MRSLLTCVSSAILGAFIALALTQHRPAGDAAAQDPPRNSNPFAQGNPGREGRSRPALPRLSPPAETANHNPGADELVSIEEQVNIAVYENVNKSVVHITTKGVKADALFLLDLPTEGSGSGSVLDDSGHILTNYHVIEDARQVSVTLFDGKSYDAKFVGADAINDLCVIKIDAPPETLHPVIFGDSAQLKVGMRVFALGNPFGLERTLTTGIISSLNRSLQIHNNRTIKSIIQIDAAINPGNSGGPLLDTRSRLIGMNTAIASKTGQSSGVGFAIPVNLIARIVPQLISRGRVVRPESGISRVFETERGLLIFKLIPGGPAERAHLQGPQVTTRKRGPLVFASIDRSAADLITAVNGEKVTTGDDFLGLIEAHEPGERVILTIIRQGRELQIPIVLGSGDETASATPKLKQ